jgi:two-component system alkaline phosphatase synthesis response regulator PhoP
MRILVVEDVHSLANDIAEGLRDEGFAVDVAYDGLDAAAKLDINAYQVVVLDRDLPGIHGDTLCRMITESDRPAMTLMLTAAGTSDDRISGLSLGADDYLTKPFSPRELVLRAQAIVRRGRDGSRDEAPASFGGGELRIDEATRTAVVRGAAVPLTPTEWALLVALASSPGRVYSRYELIQQARGYEFDGYERTVDSHVKNLRRKLEDDPRAPRIVETVLGGGYRLGLQRDG